MDVLHTALVMAFDAVTALLLLLTLVHRLRVRRVILSWRVAGRRFPVWPVLFITVVAGLAVYAIQNGSDLPIWVFGGYMLGGAMWLGASLIGGSVVVTDYGIVPEIGKPREAIAWMQVSDYFEVEGQRRSHFAFMYHVPEGQRRRLDIAVPPGRVRAFRVVVREKLDGATRVQSASSVGRKALEE